VEQTLRTERLLIVAIKCFLIAMLFIPLVSSTLFIQPYVFPKLFFFYLFSLIIIFLYIWLCAKSSKYWPAISAHRGDRIPLTLTILILILFLTSLFSANLETSLIGTVAWANGFVTIFICYLLFMVAKTVLSTEDSWQFLFKFNFGIGTIVAAYAIVQQLGSADSLARIGATFGNPIYLAAYLVFTLASAALVYTANKDLPSWKIVSALSFIIQLIALVFATQARSSILGIGAGIFLALAVWALSLKKSKVRTRALIGLMVVIVILVSLCFAPNSKLNLAQAFGRGDTARTRMIAWQITGKAIIEKPLQGFGIENFIIPFEKYYNPLFYDKKSGDVVSEYDLAFPHNKILEIASSNGVIAALIYLLLFVVIFQKVALNYLKSRKFKYLIIMALFTAYFVQNFFSFDTFLSIFFFLLFVAYLDYPLLSQKPEKSNPAIAMPIVAIALVIASSSFYCLALKPAQAAYSSMRAFSSLTKQNYRTSMQEMIRSHSYHSILTDDFFDREMIKLAVKDAKVKTSLSSEQQEFHNYLINRIKAIIENHPDNIANYSFLSDLYLAGGIYDQEYYSDSIRTAESALSLGSKRAEYYYMVSEAAYKLGKNDQALGAAREAVGLNQDSGYSHYFLGSMYLRVSEDKKGYEELAKAKSLGYAGK